MGRINLEAPSVGGIALGSDPDWTPGSLISELSIYDKSPTYILRVSGNTDARKVSQPKNKQIPKAKKKDGGSKAFVIRVTDEDWDDVDEKAPVAGWSLSLSGEVIFSDSEDFEDNAIIGSQNKLMSPVGIVEATLSEITRDRQRSITDEIRAQQMDLETSLMTINENFASNLALREKQAEAKLEAEMRSDSQYRRELAEALDTCMVAIQREREHKSQIEERRIRDDAVREEAQKKERAAHEEKLRQEKIEAETKARVEAEIAEAAKAAALEAERRAAEEVQKQNLQDQSSHNKQNLQSTENLIKCAESALNQEVQRSKIYEELSAQNHALRTSANVGFSAIEKPMNRYLKTMTGAEDNVRERSDKLKEIINDKSIPQCISIMMFVDMIVAQCKPKAPNRFLYAYGQCAVLVSSMNRQIMDVLIAKLNKVCIYTVPKHISHSKSAFETNDAYYKAIGFQQEDDGKNESTDDFLERMTSCVKLYGAIVQTEVRGLPNHHGLEEGWKWLARFVNALPPNLFTATALHSFIEVAGYALYRRYGKQFVKMLAIISRGFVEALPEDLKKTTRMVNFRDYLNSKQYLKEPEDRVKQVYLQSRDSIVD